MTVQMLSIIGTVVAVAVGSISPALAEGPSGRSASSSPAAPPAGQTRPSGDIMITPDVVGDDSRIGAGNLVRSTGTVASVPVGDKLLGRIVNALGVAMDGGPEIEAASVEPVERPAPAIVDRDFVDTALNTGSPRH